MPDLLQGIYSRFTHEVEAGRYLQDCRNDMKLMNNKVALGALVLIAIAVAYFLLVYLPKQQELRLQQQETNLRRQTYEICLKEYDELSDSAGSALAQRAANREITEQEMQERILLIVTGKDKIVTNCVEKRLGEYKK